VNKDDLIRRSCGEASADAEVFAGRNVVPSAVDELVGSLCGQIERAEEKAQRWAQQLMAERKRANDAERKHAEAIEALTPFARLAEGISDFWDGERRIGTLNVEPIRIHHVRRAHALVTLARAASGNTNPSECSAGTARTADAIPGEPQND